MTITINKDQIFKTLFKIIPFVLVFAVGCFAGYKLAPVKTITKVETKVETKYVEVEGKTKTEVQYVYKESPKDADVEITNTKPTVSVNGKKYEFEKLPEEKYKFENGKLQVEQGYNLKIDASALVPKQPKWGADIGYSNHGVYTGVRYNFNRNVSAYVGGTPKAVRDRDRYFGGGITINF